jgi:Glycosyl hydrolase family 79, N-terminal domain
VKGADTSVLFGPTRPLRRHRNHLAGLEFLAALVLIIGVAFDHSRVLAGEPVITPATLAPVGSIDERFQSYNVEMVEVSGGLFWKPYDAIASDTHAELYAHRAPIDLGNARLRRLAAALGPAYMRISGTWANATYFADSNAAPSVPPPGFNGVLTRQQWQGVIEFSHAVDAPIVTSFATSAGTRDAAGVWLPDQAQHLLAYTASAGGRIAAVEFMNEANLAANGLATYDVAAYGRDFETFRALMKRTAPDVMILGPGTVGVTSAASNLLAVSGPVLDGLSYHHYGMLSERCTGVSEPHGALSEQWLARTEETLGFYRTLRDRFEPGKPIWLTETAESACGGNRWAATFLDTFRYLDQLGRLAKAGVQIVMHNTLAASDYGLLDENTLSPRPNYWGALLWRQLMGTTVLDPDVSIRAGFHIYAHCQRGTPGGVSILVINSDRNTPHALTLASAAERYILDAADLRDGSVRLNGHRLELAATGDLPSLMGIPTASGVLTFAPATITFLIISAANNDACR